MPDSLKKNFSQICESNVDGMSSQLGTPATRASQPMNTQEKRLPNPQSKPGFPLRPVNCSPTKDARLSHSPAGDAEGEGVGEGELETQ